MQVRAFERCIPSMLLPSSCGNSSQNMATDTLTPVEKFSEKPAPIAIPSTKLCKESPTSIIQAVGAIDFFFNVSVVPVYTRKACQS